MPPARRALPFAAALACLSLVSAACSDGTDDASSTTTRPAPTTTAASSAGADSAGEEGAAASPTGRFHVVGADIVDPDGNVFVPIGANMAVRQGNFEEGYAFNWNGTGTGRVDDVLAWGWNTVRATLVCSPTDGPTVAELDAGIDAFIEEYTSRRVVVMVECHDITGDDLPPDAAAVQGVLEFTERLARRWKDEPYVWFNPLNEPQTGTDPADVDNWRALQAEAYDRVRAIAPTSVFVADLPGHAQGLSTLTGDEPVTSFGADRCNVIYGWHAYGAVGQDGAFGEPADDADEAASLENHRKVFEFLRTERIPVVIGEVGDPLTLDEGTAGQPIWNRYGARSVIELAPDAGVGLIWWHATGDSGVFLTYSLMADREQAPWSAGATGEGLSDGGRRFWEAGKALAAAPPTAFTGDLTADGCA